eukprot:5481546-Pyramimonas_sp.AAC.1
MIAPVDEDMQLVSDKPKRSAPYEASSSAGPAAGGIVTGGSRGSARSARSRNIRECATRPRSTTACAAVA